jgi:hypothetical protein
VSTYAADYRMAGAAAFTDSDREEALNTN